MEMEMEAATATAIATATANIKGLCVIARCQYQTRLCHRLKSEHEWARREHEFHELLIIAHRPLPNWRFRAA
jgi:hypothetical protein